jgi:hypothetical protein
VIVTEEQARKLWCPQAFVAVPGGLVNRISTARIRFAEAEATRTNDARDRDYYREQLADTMCRASGCMFWQFVGYGKVASGNDEAHGCCGLTPDIGAPTGSVTVERRGRADDEQNLTD